MRNLPLLIVLLFAGCSSFTSIETDFIEGEVISPNSDYFSYIGRFDQSVPEKVMFSWSSSRISFQFKGTGCDILLSSRYGKEIYYNVTLDNKKTILLKVDDIHKRYKLFRNLKPELHTVTIERRNEYFAGLSVFEGIILDAEGEIYEAEIKNRRLIEYIGDSNTTGFGIDAEGPEEPYTFITQDSSKSYAAVASEILESDYNIIAWSGKGVYMNYGQNRDETIPEIYDFITQDSKVRWSYENSKPDLIVINLGANDFSIMPPEKEEFINVYKQFIVELTSKCSDTPIMCIVAHSLSDNWPLDSETGQPYKTRTIIKDYMNTLKLELGNNGIDIGLIIVPLTDHSLPFGALHHPGLKQSENTGRIISEKIKEYMNW